MTRILCTGDRNWSNRALVYRVLATLTHSSTVIHGGARGLDTIAAQCALELNLLIDLPPTRKYPLGGYPAEWDKYHKAAGPIRNTRMLFEGKPDEVWAWHNDLKNSRGTRNMVEQSQKAGLPVHLFSEVFPDGLLLKPFPGDLFELV